MSKKFKKIITQHDHVKFMPGNQGRINTYTKINVIHCINLLEEKKNQLTQNNYLTEYNTYS